MTANECGRKKKLEEDKQRIYERIGRMNDLMEVYQIEWYSLEFVVSELNRIKNDIENAVQNDKISTEKVHEEFYDKFSRTFLNVYDRILKITTSFDKKSSPWDIQKAIEIIDIMYTPFHLPGCSSIISSFICETLDLDSIEDWQEKYSTLCNRIRMIMKDTDCQAHDYDRILKEIYYDIQVLDKVNRIISPDAMIRNALGEPNEGTKENLKLDVCFGVITRIEEYINYILLQSYKDNFGISCRKLLFELNKLVLGINKLYLSK